MRIRHKAILLFVIIASFSGMLYSTDFVLADRDLELDYPTAPSDAVTPSTTKTTLPEYVKYLFNFLIGIGGILAFTIFIYGGVMWMFSAGNPGIIGLAKKKMINGGMGLALLLCSYLIIYTINPDLTVMRLGLNWEHNSGPEITPSDLDATMYQEIPIGLLVENILAKNISTFDSEKNLIDGRTRKIIQGSIREEPLSDPIPPECIIPADKMCKGCWLIHNPECICYYQRFTPSEADFAREAHYNYSYQYDDEGNKEELLEYHDRLDYIKKLAKAIAIKSAELKEKSEELETAVNECKCDNCDHGYCLEGCPSCPANCVSHCHCCGSPREEWISCSGDPPYTLYTDPCKNREKIDELRNEIYQIINGTEQKIEGADIVDNPDHDPKYLSLIEAQERLKGLKKELNDDLNDLLEAEELVKFPSFVKRLNLQQYLDKKPLENLEKERFKGKTFSPPGYDSVARYCKIFNCSNANGEICAKYELNDDGILCNLSVLDGAPSTFYHNIKEYEKPN